MITLALEEFAAKRKKAQTDIEDALRPHVRKALDLGEDTSGFEDLIREVRAQYAFTYADEGGDRGPGSQADTRWLTKVLQTLKKTKGRSTEVDEASVERITVWLATAILTEATIQASTDDPEELFMEWVDMHDSHVREAHHEANGQRRPVGEKFTVGGHEMDGPGDPTVPIELWINCRCTLRPVLAEDALTAASDKPWDGSASRFTPEQWKRSCILHVCDGMEKSCHKLPIREPSGALSRAGVHAAAGRIGSAQGPPEKIAAAKSSLRGAYKQLGETPPESLTAGGPMTDTAPETDEPQVAEPVEEPNAVPWHGVLAPEGVKSGDGRMFGENALSNRDLPLPLTWQKISDDGHKGSVTVAKIEKLERVGNLIRASGHFLPIPEADEVVGLIGEFGKFGVSVDADDATFEVDEEAETVVFTSARISSASIVAIPAFAEAYVCLGEWDEADKTPPVEEPVEQVADEPPVYQGEVPVGVKGETGEFVNTEDGPGWLTHPVDTDRLRDYWVRGPGAAKIGWGSPGDFNRCRINVAKYVKPQHLNGYCANRHYDALGFWPGRPVAGDTDQFAAENMGLEDKVQASAISLLASMGHKAPAAWFQNPGLTEPTPLTITDEGQVYGHIATWDSCHIGYGETCTSPPHSATGYAYFLTGEVALDDGTRAPVGNITIGGGHAGPRLGMRSAMAHYDSTSAAAADITVGEDEVGIWFAGWIRPGTSDEMVTALRASALSGDWRRTHGDDMEMCAALAVNVPGFGIPRVRVAASSQGQVSLVASGVVAAKEQPEPPKVDVPELAEAVAAAIEERQLRRDRMRELAARVRGEQ